MTTPKHPANRIASIGRQYHHAISPTTKTLFQPDYFDLLVPVIPLTKKVALLLIAAAIPTVAQLTRHGWQVPAAASPFIVSVAELGEKEPIVWIDTREDNLFHERHVPGAVNLNSKNWEQKLAQLFETFEPGKTVVVYCSAGCQESEHIAARIRELGIEPALILEGGFEAWRKGRWP
jgi:rhodanese-related sulfurtransferase